MSDDPLPIRVTEGPGGEVARLAHPLAEIALYDLPGGECGASVECLGCRIRWLHKGLAGPPPDRFAPFVALCVQRLGGGMPERREGRWTTTRPWKGGRCPACQE